MSERIETLKERLSPASRQALRVVLLDHSVEIVSCIFFKNAAPWSILRRVCPDSLFLIPTKGRLRVVLDSTSKEISPGEYLMLPEGCPHALGMGKGCKTLHQISVHCQIHDRWNRPLLTRFGTPFGTIPSAAHWLDAFMDLACLTEMEANFGLAQAFGENLLRALLVKHVQSDRRFDPTRVGGDPRIEHALQLMEERFASPLLSIEEIARSVGLSPMRFRTIFRHDTGASPKEYLTRIRMRKATRMLRDPLRSIKQTALDCGFSADHYFHRVFRKTFGCTPSEYRDQHTV